MSPSIKLYINAIFTGTHRTIWWELINYEAGNNWWVTDSMRLHFSLYMPDRVPLQGGNYICWVATCGGSLVFYNLRVLVLNANWVSRSSLTQLRVNGMAWCSRNCALSKNTVLLWALKIHKISWYTPRFRDRVLNKWILSFGTLVHEQ